MSVFFLFFVTALCYTLNLNEMSDGGLMEPTRRKRAKRRKRGIGRLLAKVAALVLAILFAGALALYIRRYAPTDEQMDLTEYYQLDEPDAAVVIADGVYVTDNEENAFGLISGGAAYIELGTVKDVIDNGYVYDDREGVLRYTTDVDVISARLNETGFTIGKDTETMDVPIVVKGHDKVFLAADFIQRFSDMQYTLYEEVPARIVVENAGYTREVATLKSRTPIRRLGGPKSKVLKKGSKGEKVTVLDVVGKWTNVLTEDGVIGYVKSSSIKDKEEASVPATLPERKYEHTLSDKRVILGWHQTTSLAANATLSGVLSKAGKINVISPTWFHLNDNSGGIENHASSDYVKEAHNNGLDVWGLVSNFEDPNVDTATVLNTTSARDNLINNLVGAAIAVGLDGINIDFELLPSEAADGYAEFIRELSLKCRKNDLVLSADVGVPTAWSMYYDRTNLANYCDYVIVMAYDEHYNGSEEPGSTASLPWVREGVVKTLEEVPPEQFILGMPFYSRVWTQKDGDLSSLAIHMSEIAGYIERNDLKQQWKEKEEQNYVEYTDEGTKHMLWIEDATSMGERLALMEENALGGCAFWKLGSEPKEIWEVIDAYADE